VSDQLHVPAAFPHAPHFLSRGVNGPHLKASWVGPQESSLMW